MTGSRGRAQGGAPGRVGRLERSGERAISGPSTIPSYGAAVGCRPLRLSGGGGRVRIGLPQAPHAACDER